MELLSFRLKYTKEEEISKTTNQHVTKYYPFVPCKISSGIKTTRETHGLIDSGSDGCVLPYELAVDYLNLKLEESEPIQVVGSVVKCYESRADFIIGRGGRVCSPIRNVKVNIPAEGDTPVILGREPFFELFKITFIEPEKIFLMEPI